MAAYRRVDDLVTCGLTACTPGSAPGSTLDNQYGKHLLSPSASEVTTIWRYTNVYIIIIIIIIIITF